jgi:hypothetical protein
MHEVLWTFSKHLKGISNSRQRFNIHLVDHIDGERKSLDGSIKSIWKFFNQSHFEKSDLETKKKIITDLVTESMLTIAPELAWDEQAIIDARDSSIGDEYTFSFTSPPKSNRKRKAKACIKLTIDKDKASIFVVSDVDQKEVLLTETFLPHIDWLSTFKSPKWINDDEFGYAFDGNVSLTYSQRNDSVQWNNIDSEIKEGFVRQVTYRTFESDQERVEWMNK